MPILHWLNRQKSINAQNHVPYRLLKADLKLSYGDEDTENMLIRGDNLDALKSLLPYYAGKVKCIYIDPPYNTGSAFEYYDDNLEHSTWLSMIYPRLEILSQLLSEDGYFCCHIDDAEAAYLKVILDEIFGRNNYETTLYIQVRYLNKTLKLDMAYHKQIEQVHIYRKSRQAKPTKPQEDANFDKFNIKIKTLTPAHQTLILGGKNIEVFLPDQYEIIKLDHGNSDGLKEIWATGSILDGNSSGRFFRDYLSGRFKSDGYGALYKVSRIGDDQFAHRYSTGPKKEGATKGKYYQ
ncbi:MAG: site-specific DNA-methyltransferase [Gammaproteobacteria bacterium]|nr:site-specific DNA-methyltransferase [Gammaproteobacteria bacterium]